MLSGNSQKDVRLVAVVIRRAWDHSAGKFIFHSLTSPLFKSYSSFLWWPLASLKASQAASTLRDFSEGLSIAPMARPRARLGIPNSPFFLPFFVIPQPPFARPLLKACGHVWRFIETGAMTARAKYIQDASTRTTQDLSANCSISWHFPVHA